MQKRPKLQTGSPVATSAPTSVGVGEQFRCAVPAAESPVGWQCTASCWLSTVGVLPLLKVTARSPFGSTFGSEPWSKLHACSSAEGSKKFPKLQRAAFEPLMGSGFDQCRAWSVDIDP